MSPILFWTLFSLVVGLLVGSFLNVVIYRLPVFLFNDWRQQAREILAEQGDIEEQKLAKQKLKTQKKESFNIAYPASHCPKCEAPIKPWHNIPLISYFLMLKGHCASCGVKISLRYPIIEAVTGILTAFVVFELGITPTMGLVLVFTWCLIALTMIDIDHQILPDDITMPLIWLGLFANFFEVFTDLESALIGAIAGYLSLWSVYWLFKLIAKKEGMGFGDFKLLAALGAWMGWQQLPLIILLSSLVGAVIGVAGIIIMGRDKNIPIPFGPYLAIAGWIAFFWGDTIKNHYFQLANIG